MSRLNSIEVMVQDNEDKHLPVCELPERRGGLCKLHVYLRMHLDCNVCPLDNLEKWEEFKPCLD